MAVEMHPFSGGFWPPLLAVFSPCLDPVLSPLQRGSAHLIYKLSLYLSIKNGTLFLVTLISAYGELTIAWPMKSSQGQRLLKEVAYSPSPYSLPSTKKFTS